jgi:hypothetical protein
MYNSNGKCSIDLTKPLEKPLLNYFTDANVKYYAELQEKIKKIEEISNETKSSLKDSTNGLLVYTKDNTIVTFPFERVCRIKGNFNHLIHHNYWHYRSRIDWNGINLMEE